jgi:hypothetical protein
MRMFQFIGPVLLVITLAGAASAQASTPRELYYTDGDPNGRFWLSLTQGEKVVWLFGYSAGIKVAATFVHVAEPDNKPLQQTILDLQPSDKLTTTEMAAGMDHFYQDTPENAPVIMAGAFRYVMKKAKGAPQSELDEMASKLRKANITPEKKP